VATRTYAVKERPPVIPLGGGLPGAASRGPRAKEILETDSLSTDPSACRSQGEALVADALAQEHSTQSHLLGDGYTLGEAPLTSPASGPKIGIKRWLKERLSKQANRNQEVDTHDAEANYKGVIPNSAEGSSLEEPYGSMKDVTIVGVDMPSAQRHLDESDYSSDGAVLGSQRCPLPVSTIPGSDESMGRPGLGEHTVSGEDGCGDTPNDGAAPPSI